MLVSIIIPVYKVEECYLRNSIESVLTQTYENIEVIIIDDGSPDNCGSICDKYADMDKRVSVYHLSNGGVSLARNYGLEHCHGDYIMFVDSDDYLAKNYVENMLEQCLKYDVDCICSKCRYVTKMEVENDRQKKLSCEIFSKEEALDELFYLKKVSTGLEIGAVWGTLYKYKLISTIRFEANVIMAEDFLFKYNVFRTSSKIAILDYDDYYYLQRVTSAMHNGFNKKRLNTIRVLERYLNTLTEKHRIGFIARSVNIAFSILMMIPNTREFECEREVVISFIKKYRWLALVKSKARLKVKIAIVYSYINTNLISNIFNIEKAAKNWFQ